MLGMSGRATIVLLLVVCVSVALVLQVGRAGFGWGESAAAREALTKALAELPREAPPAQFAPPVNGQEATPDQAAAIDKTVNAYLKAIADKQAEAAWEMVDPQHAGDMTKESWAAQFEAMGGEGALDSMEAAMGLLMGQKSRVAEVATSGTTGVARVIVPVDAPLWLALVKRGDAWAVDLQGSADLQAYHDVGKQLATLQRDDATSFFRAIIGMQGGAEWNDYLSLLVLAPQAARHEIASRKVDGERAVAQVQGHAELQLSVPLERKAQGWVPNWTQGVKIISAEQQLAAEGEGSPREKAMVFACQSNLKQAMLGILQYCQDYDEKFPPANQWTDVIYPYIKNESVYKCPAVPDKFGYAMNYKLSRAVMAQLASPAETVSLFDSTLLRPNAQDYPNLAGASVTWPPRHNGMINYAFTDGHVKAMTSPLPYPYYYQLGGRAAPPYVGPGAPPGGGKGGPPPPPPPPPPGAMPGGGG